MMTLNEFVQTLPTLPDGYEWEPETYMVDTFKFGWTLKLVKVIPGGWFGLFDKREPYRINGLVTYTDEIPAKEFWEWAENVMTQDNLWVDNTKKA